VREAAVYARVNGYLKSWSKDLGDAVREGEILAKIDAPEMALELRQARATREQVHARLSLAETSLERWDGLRKHDAVSQQELDERRGADQQALADLAAADANVHRLEALEAFRNVVAPFDGVVIRRNAEVGGLVGAGVAGGVKELYYIAQIDPLRVDVFVPQTYAADVHVGQEVTVHRAERPGESNHGFVARAAGGLEPTSRTLQVAIELSNPKHALMPGLYVEVTLDLHRAETPLLVPPGAVQFRQAGPRVAAVENGYIHWRTVTLGREQGRWLEVLTGVTLSDRIVQSPPDSIEDGESVHAQLAPTPIVQKAAASSVSSTLGLLKPAPFGNSGVAPKP